MTTDLLKRTKALLREALAGGNTLPEIARESGLGYEWMKKFAADDIPDPGVRRVQKLHDFLTGLTPRASAPSVTSLQA